MADFYLFLNILPPPDSCQVGLDDSDWNILLEDGWINSGGFLVQPSDELERSRLSQSGRQFLQGIYAQRNWKRSAVAAVKGLVPLRNMSAFFQQSDLESILFSKWFPIINQIISHLQFEILNFSFHLELNNILELFLYILEE